jgi:hypothetical protein
MKACSKWPSHSKVMRLHVVLALFGADFFPDHFVQLALWFHEFFVLREHDGPGYGFEDYGVPDVAAGHSSVPAHIHQLLESKVSPTGVIVATYKRDGEIKRGSF